MQGMQSVEFHMDVCLALYFFPILTNDLTLAHFTKACVSTYADDTTICTYAPSVNEITACLNRELQTAPEWVTSSKLVLNISKTKSIVFGTSHALTSADPGIDQYGS